MEVIFAAGRTPVDLNNRFITSSDPVSLVERAEQSGIPPAICSWIKGIYAVVHRDEIPVTVCVTGGDCSNTTALMEVFEHEGISALSFDYPYERERGLLEREIRRLAEALDTRLDAAEDMFQNLRPVRVKLAGLDRLTWEQGLVTGMENHEWLVNSSDFQGDWKRYEERLDAFLDEAKGRKTLHDGPRIAFVGVPPIMSGLYDFIEEHGARVVLNETQRAFSMPYEAPGMLDAWLAYTYPYSIFHRLADIEKEVSRRKADGLIHYVQNACYRQIGDKILRARSKVPVLTLEGDRPGPLDAQQKTRIEAFLEILEG